MGLFLVFLFLALGWVRSQICQYLPSEVGSNNVIAGSCSVPNSGTTCTLSCASPYLRDGSFSVTCTGPETWTALAGTCKGPTYFWSPNLGALTFTEENTATDAVSSNLGYRNDSSRALVYNPADESNTNLGSLALQDAPFLLSMWVMQFDGSIKEPLFSSKSGGRSNAVYVGFSSSELEVSVDDEVNYSGSYVFDEWDAEIWHHIVVRRSSLNGGDNTRLTVWVDGQLQDDRDTDEGVAELNGVTETYLGANPPEMGSSDYLDGQLGVVRLYTGFFVQDEDAMALFEEETDVCGAGNKLSPDRASCVPDDVNECTENTHNCSISATCSNLTPGFSCTCNSGYTGDGVNCTGVNECALGLHNCSINADCSDITPGFTCSCNSGYTGDGFTCTDVNECLENTHNCSTNATCNDLTPGFDCKCNLHFAGDGVTCEACHLLVPPTPVNPAAAAFVWEVNMTWYINSDFPINVKPASPPEYILFHAAFRTYGQVAKNSDLGGWGEEVYVPDLPAGPGDTFTVRLEGYKVSGGVDYTLFVYAVNGMPDVDGVWNTSFAHRSPLLPTQIVWGDSVVTVDTCKAVDECFYGLNNCSSDAACTDLPLGFSCSCNPGYTGDGVECTPVNECALGLHNCSINADCSDITPGFNCSCKSGFTGDGVNCTDVNECTENTHNCSINATCSNLSPGFSCACNWGYTGDGVICTGVNECQLGTNNCSTHATCSDLTPGFSCACNSGYTGDGVACTGIDECASDLDNCGPNATCTDQTPFWSCACNNGFLGDGVVCEPENPTNEWNLAAVPLVDLVTGANASVTENAEYSSTTNSVTFPGYTTGFADLGRAAGALGTSNFTITIWFNKADGRDSTLFGNTAHYMDPESYLMVQLNSTILVVFASNKTADNSLAASVSMTVGVWHQLAVRRTVVNGSQSILSVYFDGQLVLPESVSPVVPTLGGDAPLYVGGQPADIQLPSYYMKGSIARTKIWRRALSAQEIATEFATSQTSEDVCKAGYGFNNARTDCISLTNECEQSPCMPNSQCVDTNEGYECVCNANFAGDGKKYCGPANPVHWYVLGDTPRVDKVSGTAFTIKNGVTDSTTRGVTFPGGPTQGYADFGAAPGAFGNTPFTVAIWYLKADTVNRALISNRMDGSWGQYFGVRITDSVYDINAHGPSGHYYTFNAPGTSAVGRWHHMVLRREGTGAQSNLSVVVDGKLLHTNSVSNFSPIPGVNSLLAGGEPVSTIYTSYYWKGSIATVKIWHRPISDVEVQEQFANVSDVCQPGYVFNADRSACVIPVDCPVPAGWCTAAGLTQQRVDCNGDGLFDLVCTSTAKGSDGFPAQVGMLLSGSCVDAFPKAPVQACPAVFGCQPSTGYTYISGTGAATAAALFDNDDATYWDSTTSGASVTFSINAGSVVRSVGILPYGDGTHDASIIKLEYSNTTSNWANGGVFYNVASAKKWMYFILPFPTANTTNFRLTALKLNGASWFLYGAALSSCSSETQAPFRPADDNKKGWAKCCESRNNPCGTAIMVAPPGFVFTADNYFHVSGCYAKGMLLEAGLSATTDCVTGTTPAQAIGQEFEVLTIMGGGHCGDAVVRGVNQSYPNMFTSLNIRMRPKDNPIWNIARSCSTSAPSSVSIRSPPGYVIASDNYFNTRGCSATTEIPELGLSASTDCVTGTTPSQLLGREIANLTAIARGFCGIVSVAAEPSEEWDPDYVIQQGKGGYHVKFVLENGPNYWFVLNDSPLNDRVQNAPATLVNGVTESLSTKSASFGGSARRGWADLGKATGAFGVDPFVVALWVKKNTPDVKAIIANRNDGSRGNFFTIRMSQTRITFELDDLSVYSALNSDVNIPMGQWFHIAVRRSIQGSTSKLSTWINGNLVGSMTVNGITRVAGNYPLLAGAEPVSPSFPNYYLDGSIATIKIYRREVSDAEITALSALYSDVCVDGYEMKADRTDCGLPAPNNVWVFSDIPFKDRVTGTPASFVGTPQSENSAIVAVLDGTSTYANLTSVPGGLGFSSFSISTWVKLLSAPGRLRPLISNRNTPSRGNYFSVMISATNLVFSLDDSSTQHTLSADFSFALNRYYHIMVKRTVSGSDSLLTVYVDGTQVGSETGTGVVNLLGSEDLLVGSETAGAKDFTHAAVGTIRVWKRDVPQQEIRSLAVSSSDVCIDKFSLDPARAVCTLGCQILASPLYPDVSGNFNLNLYATWPVGTADWVVNIRNSRNIVLLQVAATSQLTLNAQNPSTGAWLSPKFVPLPASANGARWPFQVFTSFNKTSKRYDFTLNLNGTDISFLGIADGAVASMDTVRLVLEKCSGCRPISSPYFITATVPKFTWDVTGRWFDDNSGYSNWAINVVAPNQLYRLFHFNPRKYTGYVVRNTYSSSGWGIEETSGGLPVQNDGSLFTVRYLFQQNAANGAWDYTVVLNGTTYTYKARLGDKPAFLEWRGTALEICDVDIDECATGQAEECGVNTVCVNTIGSYYCGCKDGFVNVSNSCVDEDECQTATAQCSVNAACKNTYGSYLCVCNSGYTGNGAVCEDLNECAVATACPASSTCVNTVGSYNCVCNAGTFAVGSSCIDCPKFLSKDVSPIFDFTFTGLWKDTNPTSYWVINVMSNVPGRILFHFNTRKAENCVVRNAYLWAGWGVEERAGGLPYTLNGAPFQLRLLSFWNSTSGYGYRVYVNGQLFTTFYGRVLDEYPTKVVLGDGSPGNVVVTLRNCHDDDECALNTHSCSPSATCTNTMGSYTCACNPPYIGDGFNCRACSPGQYVGPASECLSCQPGRYSDSMNAATCTPCPAGTEQPYSAQTTCRPCRAGTYQPTDGSLAPCSLCPQNTYAPNISSTSCLPCPASTVAPLGASGCAPNCADGEYYNATSSTCIACTAGTYLFNGRCLPCPPGTFSGSSATACSRCPIGSVSDGASSSCTPCPTGTMTVDSITCLSCPPGTFKPDGFLCQACPAGKYTDAERQTSCNNCTENTYQPKPAQAMCLPCGHNEISAAGAVACTKIDVPPRCGTTWDDANSKCGIPCPSRTDQECVATGEKCFADLSPCTPLCPAGSYSTTGSPPCEACPAGTYSTGEGSKICLACAPGFFNGETNQTACQACPKAKYAAAFGQTTCDACKAPGNQPLTGMTRCACPAGAYTDCVSLTSATPITPDDAARGFVWEVSADFPNLDFGIYVFDEAVNNMLAYFVFGKTGQTVAGSAISGNFGVKEEGTHPLVPGQRFTLRLEGANVGNGWDYRLVANDGAWSTKFLHRDSAMPNRVEWDYDRITFQNCTGCTYCSAGTYNPSPSQTQCMNCSLGKYAPSGLANCLACSKNTFASPEGRPSCTKCPTGTFSVAGSASCSPSSCAPGTFNQSNSCVNCNPGSYSNVSGAASCTPCEVGFYQSASAQTTCVPCAIGKSSAAPFTSCAITLCPPGTSYDATNETCTPCALGTYSDSVGAPECMPCLAGTYSGLLGQSQCTNCSAGSYQDQAGQSSCVKCDAASYQDLTGATSCLECDEGKIANADFTDCQYPDCEPGFYRDAATMTCAPCRPGTFTTAMNENQCTPCPVGTIQPMWQSTMCFPCGAGLHTGENEGSTQCLPCWPGTFSVMRSGVCTPCDATAIAPQAGSYACVPCGPGTEADVNRTACVPIQCNGGFALEGSECTACPAGKATRTPNVCSLCPSGKYAPAQSANCTDASPGSFVPTTGAADQTPCPAGSFAENPAAVVCTPCEAGKYANTTGEQICSDCPSGTYSSEGAQECAAVFWNTTDWSVCSTTCDPGTQTRVVECVDGAGATQPTTACAGVAPHSIQECLLKRCIPLPPTPIFIETATPKAGVVYLSWVSTPALFVETYELEMGEVDGPTAPVSNWTVLGSGSQSFTYALGTDLRPNTWYGFRVRAGNSEGYSNYSEITLLTSPAEPTEPLNLTASTVEATAISLEWTDPLEGTPIQDFGIQFSESVPESYRGLSNQVTPNYTYTIKHLQPATSYAFQVFARNELSSWGLPAILKDVVTKFVAPPAPIVDVIEVTATSVTLSWLDLADTPIAPTEWDVTFASSSDTQTWNTLTAFFTADGLIPGQTYTVTVVARNLAGDSEPSQATVVTTLPVQASAPLNLRVDSISVGQVTLSADPPASDGGSSITMYRFTITSPALALPIVVLSATPTAVHREALVPESVYTVIAEALNAVGWSPASDALVFTTPPLPPSLVSLVAADPDNEDSVYSNGDTITLNFNVDTNMPPATKADLDKLIWSAPIGSDYHGDWSSPRSLTITINDISGAAPAIGSLSVEITKDFNLRGFGTAIRALVSDLASGDVAVLTGNWGSIVESLALQTPNITVDQDSVSNPVLGVSALLDPTETTEYTIKAVGKHIALAETGAEVTATGDAEAIRAFLDSVVATPEPGFFGVGAITFTLSDSTGQQLDEKTLLVTVNMIRTAPVVVASVSPLLVMAHQFTALEGVKVNYTGPADDVLILTITTKSAGALIGYAPDAPPAMMYIGAGPGKSGSFVGIRGTKADINVVLANYTVYQSVSSNGEELLQFDVTLADGTLPSSSMVTVTINCTSAPLPTLPTFVISNDFSEITATLNPPIVTTSRDCSQFFVDPARLGTNALCIVSSGTKMNVKFGSQATLKPGESLEFKSGSLSNCSTLFPNTNVTLAPAVKPSKLVVKLTGSAQASLCGSYSVKAQASGGTGGRAVSFYWSSSVPTALIGSTEVLTQSTSNLTIPAYNVPDGTFDLFVYAINEFGISSDVAKITVTKDSTPAPLVTILEGATTTMKRTVPNTLTVQSTLPDCLAANSLPRCGTSYEDANTKCGTPCPSGTDSECLVAGETCWTDLVNCPARQLTYSWSVSPALPMGLDASSNQMRLRLPANSLPAGVSAWTFTVRVALASNPDAAGEATITVTPDPSALVAIIKGGTSISIYQKAPHTLESGSYDPDEFEVAPSLSWSCDANGYPCLDTAGNIWKPTPNVFGPTGDNATQIIPADALLPGSYVFTLVASKGTRKAQTTQTVLVSPHPKLSVEILTVGAMPLVATSALRLAASVSGGTNNYWFSWTLNPQKSSYTTPISPQSQEGAATARIISNLKPNFEAGAIYTYSLVVTDRTTMQTGEAEITLEIAQPASGGSFTVEPAEGVFGTHFVLTADNWFSSFGPLRYQYYLVVDGENKPLGSETPSSSLTVHPLPVGNLTVAVSIIDSLGQVTMNTAQVRVHAPLSPINAQDLLDKAAASAIESGDATAVVQTVVAAMNLLDSGALANADLSSFLDTIDRFSSLMDEWGLLGTTSALFSSEGQVTAAMISQAMEIVSSVRTLLSAEGSNNLPLVESFMNNLSLMFSRYNSIDGSLRRRLLAPSDIGTVYDIYDNVFAALAAVSSQLVLEGELYNYTSGILNARVGRQTPASLLSNSPLDLGLSKVWLTLPVLLLDSDQLVDVSATYTAENLFGDYRGLEQLSPIVSINISDAKGVPLKASDYNGNFGAVFSYNPNSDCPGTSCNPMCAAWNWEAQAWDDATITYGSNTIQCSRSTPGFLAAFMAVDYTMPNTTNTNLPASIVFTLNGTFEAPAFRAAFIQELAIALGIPPTRLQLVSSAIVESTTQVVIYLHPSTPTSPTNTSVVAGSLAVQLNNPSSTLRSGYYGSRIISATTTYPGTLVKCPDSESYVDRSSGGKCESESDSDSGVDPAVYSVIPLTIFIVVVVVCFIYRDNIKAWWNNRTKQTGQAKKSVDDVELQTTSATTTSPKEEVEVF